jgi:hypothetical protein
MKLPSQGAPLGDPNSPSMDALSAGGATSGIRLQAFAGAIYTPPFIITPAAAVTPDMDNGLIQQITLNQATTINNVNSTKAGCFWTLIVRQPAAGGPHLVTWGTDFDWGDEGVPLLSVAANVYDIVSGLWLTTSIFAASTRTGFGA